MIITCDDLDRLPQADYIDSTDEVFTYDDLGNRLTVNTRYGATELYSNNVANEYTQVAYPVAHWRLNENAANTDVADSSGNNHDGDTVRFTDEMDATGQIGGALEFDGSGDYIQITESDSGLSTANFGGTDTGKVTIAAWVYLDDRYQYNIVTEYIGGLRYFTAGRPSTGKLMCRFYNNDTQSAYSPTSDAAVSQGVWTHVAVVVEAGVGYRFYIDGEKDSGSAEHTGVRLYNYTSSNTKYLGIAHFSPYDKFDGKLDNVMVFNRALSDSEIKYLYESTDEDDLTELVHDDAGNLILDHRGYSYSYDYENRLILIEKRGDSGDPDTVADY